MHHRGLAHGVHADLADAPGHRGDVDDAPAGEGAGAAPTERARLMRRATPARRRTRRARWCSIPWSKSGVTSTRLLREPTPELLIRMSSVPISVSAACDRRLDAVDVGDVERHHVRAAVASDLGAQRASAARCAGRQHHPGTGRASVRELRAQAAGRTGDHRDARGPTGRCCSHEPCPVGTMARAAKAAFPRWLGGGVPEKHDRSFFATR